MDNWNNAETDWGTAQAVWGNPQQSVTDAQESAGTSAATAKKPTKRRSTEAYELSNKFLYRRAYGEEKLLECLGTEPLKEGHAYHVITGGNVDSLSFLKCILLHQDIEYLLFSTWCMSAEDVLQFKEWIQQGRIKKLDAYVGEIFPSSYVVEWRMLNDLFNETQCGRLKCFRNHSKIYAGIGTKFPFAIETSANINTNPRTEQGVITIDKGLVDFYKAYFDKIE